MGVSGLRHTARAVRERPLAIGYCRVSTAEQADSGAGLAAQETALAAAALTSDWDLTLTADAGLSGAGLARPALQAALVALDAGEADVLAVSHLSRLSRSVADFTGVLERAKRGGWSVWCGDLALDTSTASGALMAHVVSAMAQYERHLGSDRTKAAMAARKAAGVHVGRPSSIPTDVLTRIVAERQAGASLRTIATGLTADGVPTSRGGWAWRPSTIADALRSRAAADLTAFGGVR